ncbi:MAG: penicillin acylase family protein [Frankiales bacterium]|nr:penicillin acylase family protein [Frankiales bacterium]
MKRPALAATGLAVALVAIPTTTSSAGPSTDSPPSEHLAARTVLPPGESGFFSSAAQAKYEADGDPSDFGPHVDDQRGIYWSNRSKDAGFATPQGTAATPSAGVRIYRDAAGVPLVYGNNGYDVWYGAGYAAATDRLFEIDAIRRTAQGTLAELTGPGGVPADLQERTLTYTKGEYDRMLARLSSRGQTAIRAYAAGVEQRITEARSDPSLLPAEYQVLQTTPADWSVEDTMAAGVFITRDVAAQGGLEMANVASLRELQKRDGRSRGLAEFDQLFPDDNPNALVTVTGRRFSNTTPRHLSAAQRLTDFRHAAAYARRVPLSLANGAGTGAAPAPKTGATTGGPVAHAAAVRHAVRRLEQWRHGLHGGSFAYAVSGRRTATGHAMLVSNPQLDYSYPSLLWELEVHGGGYDARGVGVPGIPTVGIGHTADVAWGLTTGYSKTIDSYIETTRPNPKSGKPAQYRHRGRWVDESCRTATIHYRQSVNGVPVGPPSFSHDYRICRTVHGPIVATTRDGRHARSVDYAQWMHDVDTVEGILRWDRAKSLADVAAGVRHVAWNENIVAADSHGNIGYWHPGRYLRRAAGVDQRFPLDGRGAQDPRGFLPYREMPHVVNPAAGFVANWNTKPAHGWVDGDLSGSNTRPGGPANRVRVIRGLLTSAHHLTLQGLMRVDTRIGESDMRAPAYLPAMLRLRGAGGLSAMERHVIRLLAHWDGRAYAPGGRGGSSPWGTAAADVTDGPAATAFAAWRDAILKRLFHRLPADILARLNTIPVESHQYDVTPLDNLALRVLRPGWAGLPAPTLVTGHRTPLAVLRATLRRAVVELRHRYGASVSHWRRPHAISHLSSLTGVVGPQTTEPFVDRGSWVQHVAFTRGRRR